jgi:hypothetical protein
MSEKSDDPRDEIATQDMQSSDWEQKRAERKAQGRMPAEVRTVNDDIVEEEPNTEHAGYSGGNGINNG